MNYLQKLEWKRYQRLRNAYRRAVEERQLSKGKDESRTQTRLEMAQHRLDSQALVHLLLAEQRKGVDIDTTKG